MMRSSIIGALVLASITSVTYADSQKPTVPTNVSAAPLTNTSVRVTWGESFDNDSVAGYNIYRDGRYYSTVHKTTSFIDTRVTAGRTYRYGVTAFDRARNYTIMSSLDSVTPGGSGSLGAAPPENGGAPAVPGGLRAEARGSDRVSVFWNDAPNATGYNVYRNGSYRTTVRDTSWTDSGLTAGGRYSYQVVAFNGRGDYSAYSPATVAETGGSGSSTATKTAAAAPAQTSTSSSSGVPSGYRLVFSEEFNGGLDSSKWNTSYRWGANWTINNEAQYYVDTNANPDIGINPFQFDGSNLNIVADKTPESRKSSANYKNYTSGTLTTYNKFKMKYGYVEMRAKLPRGKGLWPAFWLLNHYDNGAQPEIDVMEFLGHDPDTVYQVYHWIENSSGKTPGTFESSGPDFTSGFHTFGMKWEPGRIVWYVDGRETNRYESSKVSNEDMYIIVNLALGGSWAGYPDGSTPFPSRYTIDYIRAYQR